MKAFWVMLSLAFLSDGDNWCALVIWVEAWHLWTWCPVALFPSAEMFIQQQNFGYLQNKVCLKVIFHISISSFKERLVGNGITLLHEVNNVDGKCGNLCGQLPLEQVHSRYRIVASGVNIYSPLSAVVQTLFLFNDHQPMVAKLPPASQSPSKTLCYLIQIQPIQRNFKKLTFLSNMSSVQVESMVLG